MSFLSRYPTGAPQSPPSSTNCTCSIASSCEAAVTLAIAVFCFRARSDSAVANDPSKAYVANEGNWIDVIE